MNANYFGPVAHPGEEIEQAARVRHKQLTKPTSSLDRSEELGIQISAYQGEYPPRNLDDCRVYVFADDHDVTQGGVSAYPSEVFIQMLASIEVKGAGVNAIVDIAGVAITDVDTSLDHDAEGSYRICHNCGSINRKDAMSKGGVDKAVRTGIAITDVAIDGGADLLIAGDLDIGNTTPAATLIGSATNSEPVVAVGRGTGIDGEGWRLKVAAIRDAMLHVRRPRNDPVEVLHHISSPDMTAMAAFLAQAAVHRTPVILDGVVVTSATLLADQFAPGAHDWQVAGYKSAEPAHALALRHLDKEPFPEYGMCLGEGSDIVAALPLVKSGVSVLHNVATFAGAGVNTKDQSTRPAKPACLTKTTSTTIPPLTVMPSLRPLPLPCPGSLSRLSKVRACSAASPAAAPSLHCQ